MQKDEVILLGIIPYKEQNVILKTYSKGSGMLSFYMAKSRSKKASKNNFSVFSILEIIYDQGKNNMLPKLLESKIKFPLLDVRFNIQKSSMALLLSEIIGKCIKEEEVNLDLYIFLEEQILNLENSKNKFANFYLFLLCQLMSFLGIAPETNNDAGIFDLKEGIFTNLRPNHVQYLNQEESILLSQYLTLNWENAQEIKMNGNQRKEFLHQILLYYKLHLDGFENPKSLAIIEEVFHS